jgi:Flp pilus assembly protein TadG
MSVAVPAAKRCRWWCRNDQMSRSTRNGHRTARFRRLRGDGGYSVVEAAILFPLLLLLVMVVFQTALWWHARHLAQAAAQEGARVARTYQGSAAAGQAQAEDYLNALGSRLLPQRTVDVSRTATTVTVRVRARVIGIVPGLRLDVDETSASPVERYVPPS